MFGRLEDQHKITRTMLPLQYDHPNASSEPIKVQEKRQKKHHC